MPRGTRKKFTKILLIKITIMTEKEKFSHVYFHKKKYIHFFSLEILIIKNTWLLLFINLKTLRNHTTISMKK